MASLTETYQGVGEVATERQVYAGVGLFLIGVVFGIAGLIIGTTEVLAGFGIDTLGSRQIAGVLGGLGVPSILLGIGTVLPAARKVRVAALIGASIAVLAVAMFWVVYPSHWAGFGQDWTLHVSAIYALGTGITFWCLFVGVVNFKTRNDPGGTVRLYLTKDGVKKVVESTTPSTTTSGKGSVGVVGSTPSTSSTRSTPAPAPVSDGGATTGIDNSSDDGAILGDEPAPRPHPVDTYCGNCTHFEYVQSGNGIKPYCGYNESVMDDMSACDHWEANQSDPSAIR